jgi:hypothetical protein
MKKFIYILLLSFIITLPVYPQTSKNVYPKNTYINIPLSNDTSYSSVSINTYFTYMFIENTSDNFTNAKGCGADLQINQNNYTSWMIGFNISFYKEYNSINTTNLSTLNLLLGPKFYFSTANLSMYARINAGVTFFSEHTPGGLLFSVSFFPAIGLEHNINKTYKLFIESTANTYFDLMSIHGHFSINAGLITSF